MSTKKQATQVYVTEVGHEKTSRIPWKRILVAATVALLLLGIGVGLGLGLQKKATASATTTADSVSSPMSTSSVIATSTTSSTSQSSSAPAASGTASTSCPSTNGTTYQASGHTFLIMCANDIQAPNKKELGRVYQPTFNGCIEHCASLDKIQADISAVYWVNYDNTYDVGTCWCFAGTSRADGAVPSHWAANNLAWIQS